MKKKLLILSIIVLVPIVIICIYLHSKTTNINNVFECKSQEDIFVFVEEYDIPYEIHENTIHLYDVNIFENKSYGVIDLKETSGEIARIECFFSFDNKKIIDDQAEKFKNQLLEIVDTDAGEYTYEFYPLDSDQINVGETEFLSGKASKELYIYEDDMIWNISWFILSDNSVSAKISKTVTY